MNKDIPVGKKMTDKEKIAQIIAEHLCPQGKTHKRLYGSERACYSRDNFAECEKVSKCVDALIAAGLRFTFTSEFASDTQKAYKEGYLKGEEESNAEIALAKAFHDEKCAEYELVCYKLQKAEHLAKVARRALKIAVSEYSWIKGNENATSALTYDYLQQAEKELTEGRKDD